LLLPEILVLRHFDASGGTNSLAISSTEDQQKWSPKGVLSLLDALDAVMWCWLLIRIGKEPHILEYIQWWRQLVRGKSAKLEQIKSYWVDCGWKLALELRPQLPRDHPGTDAGPTRAPDSAAERPSHHAKSPSSTAVSAKSAGEYTRDGPQHTGTEALAITRSQLALSPEEVGPETWLQAC
jgi:hypothetical protein